MSVLTAADWVIIAVVVISAIISLMRGFVREAASIMAWIAAFLVTGKMYSTVAPWFVFSNDALTRNVLGVIVVFALTLILVGMAGRLLCTMVQKAGISSVDRLLGVIFGVLRGVLILSAVLALMQILFHLHILTFLQEMPWYRESILLPDLQRLVNWFFLYMSTPVTGSGA